MSKHRDPSVPLSNAQQESFAQAVAGGTDPKQAFVGAGYESAGRALGNNLRRLLGKGHISARIAFLRERPERAGDLPGTAAVVDWRQRTYQLADAMSELDEALAFAREKKNPTAIVSAVMARAKLNGLLIEKSEHTWLKPIEEWTDAECAAALAKLEGPDAGSAASGLADTPTQGSA